MVSVVVSTKNEEQNIAKCLNALSWCDDVVIVDSLSKDKTLLIASEYENVRVVNFIWDGKFPKKRNWSIENLTLKYDWVLFLDADEILTDDFVTALKSLDFENYVGYWCYYSNHFLGKKMRFGLQMKKLALFNKTCGRYENISIVGQEEFDMEIHEHPQLSGATGIIKAEILHNDFKGIGHFFDKHNVYAKWEVNRIKNLQNTSNHTLRERIKYLTIKSGLFSYIYFVYSYFFLLGFLDGRKSFYYHRIKFRYYSQIYLTLKLDK